MSMSWSIPYGSPASDPFWGVQTSAVNFCEEDYILTRYVGEFFNTVTSFAYIGYGIHGIQRYRRRDVTVFDPINYPYWALIGVGVFSGLYHATLKYMSQMSDEMSMHLAMGTVLHQLFTFREPPAVQRRNTAIILGVLVPFIIYHCVADEFAVHVVLFVAMILLVARRTRYVTRVRLATEAQRKYLNSLSTFSLAMAAFAWFLWNIDVHLCSYVTRAKRAMGLPWGALLELHGYWHILTAVAAYAFMAMIEFLTKPELDDTQGEGFAWPANDVLSKLAHSEHANGSGHMNGCKHANGSEHMSEFKHANGSEHMNGFKDADGSEHMNGIKQANGSTQANEKMNGKHF